MPTDGYVTCGSLVPHLACADFETDALTDWGKRNERNHSTTTPGFHSAGAARLLGGYDAATWSAFVANPKASVVVVEFDVRIAEYQAREAGPPYANLIRVQRGKLEEYLTIGLERESLVLIASARRALANSGFDDRETTKLDTAMVRQRWAHVRFEVVENGNEVVVKLDGETKRVTTLAPLPPTETAEVRVGTGANELISGGWTIDFDNLVIRGLP
jgi:hypothetical protein